MRERPFNKSNSHVLDRMMMHKKGNLIAIIVVVHTINTRASQCSKSV